MKGSLDKSSLHKLTDKWRLMFTACFSLRAGAFDKHIYVDQESLGGMNSNLLVQHRDYN